MLIIQGRITGHKTALFCTQGTFYSPFTVISAAGWMRQLISFAHIIVAPVTHSIQDWIKRFSVFCQRVFHLRRCQGDYCPFYYSDILKFPKLNRQSFLGASPIYLSISE